MEKREKVSEYYIYFTLGLWFFFEVLFNSNLKYILWWERATLNKAMAIITFGLLIVQIVFLQHYSTREMVLVVVGSAVIGIATLNSGYNIMMSTWLFIIASRHINMDKVVGLTYVILIAAIGIVLYFFFNGLIDEVTFYRGTMLRHSWGFTHPNWLGVRAFQLLLAHCYLRRNKLMFLDYLMLVAGAWFVNRVPNCKTAFYGLIIFLTMLIIYRAMDMFVGGQAFFAKTLVYVAVAANIVSIVLSIINVRSNQVLSKFDKSMSSRFSMCYRSLKYFGVKMFGQEIDLYVSRLGVIIHRFYIDTAYVAILIRYGLVVYVIFSILYTVAMIYCLKQNNHFMVIILSMYAIYGIMENTFFSMTQNIFLLALSYPIYLSNYCAAPKAIPRIRYKLSW